jgi:hypothetical protein
MKKVLLGIVLGISVAALLSAKIAEYSVKKSTAEVQRIQNIYMFTDATPVMEYEYLGTVKVSISLFGSGQYQDIRDKLIRKAKKDYPKAEGIIFIFKDGGVDRADVIKFK